MNVDRRIDGSVSGGGAADVMTYALRTHLFPRESSAERLRALIAVQCLVL